jgi:hypothetical protein
MQVIRDELIEIRDNFANKRQNTNYSFLPVTSKVSCIQRKLGQIICLQGDNYSLMKMYCRL